MINRTEGAFPGTGNVWALIEPEQGLRRGWYESQVFVNDELFVTLPFAIDLSEFLNERLGVAFSYPSGWTIDDSNPGLIQLMPAPGGVVQVGAFMFGPRTLDAVVSELAEGFTSLGFREVSRMTLDEEVQGYLLRFDVSFENVTVVFDTVIKFAGARLFLVSLAVAETLLDSLRADFELLTDSFSITLSPTGEPIDAGAGVSEIQGAIERRVVAVRGLEAGAPVQTGFQAREEYRAKTSSESPNEESEQEIDKVKDFCLVLDLCKESDDLLQTSRNLAAEGVLGYYDPEEKSFIVIGDEDTFGALKWMTYAHEYTHALQDEQFDLSMLQSEEETSDSTKAVGALVEGDANLVEFLFYEALRPEPQAGLATSERGY